MKVKELIIRLQKMNGESEVLTEGCDCWGEVEETISLRQEAYGDDPFVLICRPEATGYQRTMRSEG